jgi:threonylcarbamoyladenosine tRNA methylthiotransferase MtaB
MSANVLWEAKNEDGFISGYTENYIRVFSNFDENLINKISKVRLEKIENNRIIAKSIE